MNFVVYQHTNTVNGKRYIGYSKKTLEKRLSEHVKAAKYDSKDLFHQALRKYGVKVFVSEALFYEDTLKAAKETEILCILDRQPEYNMTLGGDCGPIMTGDAHPLFGEKRPDVSERNRNKVWTEQDRQAAREKQTGKTASDTARKNMSASRVGKKRGPYNVVSNGISLSNKKRKGTLAAALAAKKASEARWAKVRAEEARVAQENGSSE